MHDKTVESQCRGFNQEKLQQLKTAYAGVPVVLFSRAALYADSGRENSYRISFPERQAAFAEAYTEEYVSTVCSIAENHPVYRQTDPGNAFQRLQGFESESAVVRQTSDISCRYRLMRNAIASPSRPSKRRPAAATRR
jgi:hypothetical protein